MLFIICIQCLSTEASKAQENSLFPPSDVYRPDRLRTVVLTEAGIAVVASTALYFLWYKKYKRSRFHFFNDNSEWLQMDKIGHATSAYTIAAFQHDFMRWAGVSRDASTGIGMLSALGYMSIIEIFDGFSSNWGFSKGDMLANTLGTLLFGVQQHYWEDQRIMLRVSFHRTIYSQYNKEELGANLQQNLLKDYNGQTYWLSVNPRSFMATNASFPAYLNLSFGYGGRGMTGATSNPTSVNGKPIPSFNRTRHFYFAPDIDLSRTSFETPGLIEQGLRLIKFPAPTVEYTKDSTVKFHWLYF